MQYRKQWRVIFEVLKEKKDVSMYNSILSENMFKKWRRNKYFIRHPKAEKIHYQHICITRNIERSPLGIINMIPGSNLDIHKGIKSTKMICLGVNMKDVVS